MGFFRGVLLFIVTILLIISLIGGNVLLTLSTSLEYENVKPALTSVAGELIQGQLDITGQDINMTEEVDERLEDMQEYCENNSEYVFSYEGQTLVIPCDVISGGTEAIVEESIGNLVEEYYYKEYDCGFWDCFQTEGPMFLISEKAKDYWQGKFYWALMASIVLIVLSFFLVEHKRNWPILIGILLVVASLPFLKLESLVASLASENVASMSVVFFSSAHSIFWTCLIAGIVLIGIGIALHFVKAGTFIAKKLEEFDKKSKEKKEVEVKKKEVKTKEKK